MQRGLTYDQAPPLPVPLTFFFTAPCFALVAAALLAWAGPDALQTRWSPATLALTHLMTLGFMTMTMIGALTQLLPVVASSPMPRVVGVSATAYMGLLAGTPMLAAGLAQGSATLVRVALPLLGLGFAAFLAAALYSVYRAPARTVVVSAIRLALLALLITVILGGLLAAAIGWSLPLPLVWFIDLHAAWGLLGWVVSLVMGVSFQVVPMFQFTLPYPEQWARWLPRLLFVGLALPSVATLYAQGGGHWTAAPAVFAMLGFGLITLRLQSHRRRRQPDAILWFWRAALLSLVATAVLWSAGQLWPNYAMTGTYDLLLGCLLIAGFAYPVINGMLYKIVPFLLWFHRQASKRNREPTPNVREIMPERAIRRQFFSYLLAQLLLLGAVFQPEILAHSAGVAFLLCSGWLWYNLIAATIRSRKSAPRTVQASGAAPHREVR